MSRSILFFSTLFILWSVFFFGCSYGNSAPVINGIYAEHDGLFPGQDCDIVVLTSDPDGDSLSYHWLASRGKIADSGPKVIWTAPDIPGSYSISITVMDENGAETSTTLTLNVAYNSPPVITGLETESSGCRTNSTVMVKCTACDPECDGLAYHWRTNGGKIEGEGPSVLWIAPDELGTFTIKVSVTDSKGGMAEQSVEIEVEGGG